MRIIDKTPFITETGELSILDQVRAALKYGRSWYAEIKAQQVVIDFLNRALQRGYVLLRNAPLPGTGASIPLILVGPTGVYVMYATHLTGRYSARGDMWGTLEGETFRPARTNLLRLTSRMARAVHIYLNRQGFDTLPAVEAALLATDPGLSVDSIRPIVRVVMRDALERFAFSILQGQAVISGEVVHNIVERLQNPRSAQQATTAAALVSSPEQPLPSSMASGADGESEIPFGGTSYTFEEPEPLPTEPAVAELQDTEPRKPVRRLPRKTTRTRFSRKQWSVLIIFGVLEIILLAFFLIFALQYF